MPDAWGDLPSHPGQLPECVLCDKPTNSHGLFLRDEGDHFVPHDDPERSHFLYPVCHTCHMRHGGSAESVAQELNANRSAMLDGAGLTPSAIGEVATRDEMDYERVKALGESTVENMVHRLKPGDVVEINDDDRWLVVPVSEDTKRQFSHKLEWAMISAGGEENGAGGIVRSQKPFDDRLAIATIVGKQDNMTFEPIESMELLGKAEADLSEIEWDEVEGHV